ncbi:MAG: SLC13 family permease [Akkermansiaceae bacterium]|nr:SLC13 family permease [Akkermansiaceae bacterium]
MTLEIGLTLLVIVITLVAFIREWAAPDVLALSILCLVVALGLVSPTQMMDVFRNEAPLTIAALFVIGGALERSGAVDKIGRLLKDKLSGNVRTAILAFSALTAFFGAWLNNTALVAILLPVALGFGRSKNISASRLLMPLSYSSILGGCCTLIGTSTNLLVNGTLKDLGEKPMSMFELAPLGIPMAIAGVAYLTIFGPKLIPERSSITGALEIDLRTSPLYHLLVGKGSPLIGAKLIETRLADRESGVHVMEVRRRGTRVMTPLSKLTVQENDRVMVAMHRRRGGGAKIEELFGDNGVQVLSTVDGIVSELVIREESSLLGRTLAASDFRQKYNCVVLAVHRDGVNITSQLAGVSLEAGDTLLVITARNNLDALEATRDFVLTDSPDEKGQDEQEEAPPKQAKHIWISWATLIGVVATATLTDFLNPYVSWIPEIPIHYAALVGALCLLWMRILTPREAYTSIDWQVLLMLYGLLGLGLAMQNTGTAKFLSGEIVELTARFVSPDYLPIVLLWTVFLLTLLLTEVLSNNATAVMMVPIVVTLAHELNVDSRPFVMGVTVAASTAFALPMGYQTHMMVFGPGGYKFVDFLRVGIPLNIICWVIACTLIPFIWPF